MAKKRKEIKFYGGGYFDITEKGIKLGTLRPKGRYDFEPGEVVTAVCGDEGEVPIVAFGTENRKIKKTIVPLLLLDGFVTPLAAAERMDVFYPGTTVGTEMGLTTFVARDIYTGLDKKTQELLIMTSQEPAIKMPELRKVFFPSLAWWWAYNGGNADQWLGFLGWGGLAEPEEILELKHRHEDIIDCDLSVPDIFMTMVDKGEEGELGDLYRELVLLET